MLERCCFNMVSTTAWLFLRHGLDKFIYIYMRACVQLVCDRGCALRSKVMVRLVWDHKNIKKSHDLYHMVKIYCSTSI